MPKRKSKAIKEPEQPIAKKRKNETKSTNESPSTPVVGNKARTRQPTNKVTPPVKTKTPSTRKVSKPITKKKENNTTRRTKIEENDGDSDPSVIIKTTPQKVAPSKVVTSSRTRRSVSKQEKKGSSIVTPVTAHESIKRTRGLPSKTTTPTTALRSGGKKAQERPAKGTMPVIALQSSDPTPSKKPTVSATKKANRSRKSSVPVKIKSKKTSPKKSKLKISEIETSNGSNTECTEMAEGDSWKNAKSVYDFTVNNIQGEPVSLEKFKGNVLLIVNVASRCGLTTNNYAQLVELDEKYKDQGLRILAFPCNQFAGQEPGSNEQICAYAKKKNVNFDMFEKVDVNGKDAHPLWKYLKMKQSGTFGDLIKWNFTKFLVNREGQPVERYAPTTEPKSLVEKIESLLKSQQ